MNNSEINYTAPLAELDPAEDSSKGKKRLIKAIAITVGVLALLTLPACFLLLYCSAATAVPTVVDDPANYIYVIGPQAVNEYADKWGFSEEIFPETVDEEQVQDFVSVYYNPWDAQYLAKLVVRYPKEQYDAEMARLSAIGIDDYEGIYGAQGFGNGYKLAAMDSDEYQGMVYALSDGKDTIIYIEMIFCNYFMDLDYTEYIEKEYLPLGFDATPDNPYEEKMMSSAQ
ncbi:MAG: hypothetical protein E7559_02125 [Ruminococcaceae bacterium]|nr:hypothetical protein [Oscillospiraceae bacterium]